MCFALLDLKIDFQLRLLGSSEQTAYAIDRDFGKSTFRTLG
jgi:hypothetical protein